MHSSSDLPKTVDPFRYASHGRHLTGNLPVNGMSRLLPDLLSDQSQVTVDLEFGVDESIKVSWMKGQIKTCVELQCQRCLESFSYDIIASFLLGLVRKMEDVERLPSRYDPLLVADGVLVLNDIIEEELIINLPVVPKHPPEVCKVQLHQEPLLSKGKNPFEVIGLLREDDKN